MVIWEFYFNSDVLEINTTRHQQPKRENSNVGRNFARSDTARMRSAVLQVLPFKVLQAYNDATRIGI